MLAAALVAASLAAWLVTVDRMDGMDAGPGTDLGQLGWFLGMWATMMAAMMLPSAAPMVMLVERVSRDRDGGRRRGAALATVFAAGYLAVWAGFGLVAYGVYRALAGADLSVLSWDGGGRWVAGAVVAAAGVYQLTPLKRICLRHCRSPLHFLLHGWHSGTIGALRMGALHGLYCTGCCWGLMLVLFAVGVMSLPWMIVVALVIFAEKILPFGDRIAGPLAVALVALGLWIGLDPGSVPFLTDPAQGMQMPM
jgi:predicted metal-binding membrane protein